MESRVKSIVFWLIVLLCVLVPAFGMTMPIRFDQVSIIQVGELLGTIFVVTLFMERAQEVILTTMRARGSELLELSIRKHKRAIQRQKKINPDRDVNESLYDELEDARIRKMDYRAYTRVLALRVGLLFGLVVSVAGVRSLGVLLDAEALASLNQVQLALFTVVDVLLTGGVIAGGSDGIHKMTEAYRSYMETHVKKNKQKKNELDLADS